MKETLQQSTYIPKNALRRDYNYGGANLERTTAITSDYTSRSTSVKKVYGDSYPDWRERLRTHKGAVTSQSIEETSITVLSEAYWEVTNNYYVTHPSSETAKVTLTGNLCAVPSTPQLPSMEDLVHVDNMAKTEYLKNINGRLRSLQGLVVLGELDETLRLILKPGREIVRLSERYVRAAKKATRKNGYYTTTGAAGRALKDQAVGGNLHRPKGYADVWLEFSFGVKPLVADIKDAMQGLSRILNPADHPQYQKVNGHTQADFPQSKTSYNTSLGFVEYTYSVETTASQSVKYYGELDLKWAGFQNANTELGLDFLSIVPAAWELTPWSFLIDYFTNIGDVLGVITLPQGGVVWNAKGSAYTVDTVIKASDPILPTLGWFTASNGWSCHGLTDSVIRVRSRILRRVPDVGYFLPTLETPSLASFSHKWKQQLNVLALAITKLT